MSVNKIDQVLEQNEALRIGPNASADDNAIEFPLLKFLDDEPFVRIAEVRKALLDVIPRVVPAVPGRPRRRLIFSVLSNLQRWPKPVA